MTNIELLGYLILFMLSVLWSIMALTRDSAILSFLSWITWHLLAALHLGLGYGSLVFGLEWVFFGLGIMFLAVGIYLAIIKFLAWKQQQELTLV